jgi:hypothetical protein
MGHLIGLVICTMGALLPWRARVLYSEFLGWITQFIYFTYYGILNFILKELREADNKAPSRIEKKHDQAR